MGMQLKILASTNQPNIGFRLLIVLAVPEWSFI